MQLSFPELNTRSPVVTLYSMASELQVVLTLAKAVVGSINWRRRLDDAEPVGMSWPVHVVTEMELVVVLVAVAVALTVA